MQITLDENQTWKTYTLFINPHGNNVKNKIRASCQCGDKYAKIVWNADKLVWGNPIAHINIIFLMFLPKHRVT